jgi:predicted Rossmann-fold nucleotide-binding protein
MKVYTKMSCYFETSGGYGTLEELLEIITWAQLGIHSKPVRTHFLFLTILYSKNNIFSDKK